MADVLKNGSQLADSMPSNGLAEATTPDVSMSQANLANTLARLGQHDAAIVSYRMALETHPNLFHLHYNLGNALRNVMRFEEAVVSYHQALEINPDLYQAHCNLGITQRDLGRLDEAVASHYQALQIKPDYVIAHNSLALTFMAKAQPLLALHHIVRSLKISQSDDAKGMFVSCVKALRFTSDNREIRELLVDALTDPWGRPGDLAKAGISLVNLNPRVAGCVARANKAWPVRISAQALFEPGEPGIFVEDELLITLLNTVPICTIEMERFLTMVRYAMLERVVAMAPADAPDYPEVVFYSALARQCFINEYIYAYSEGEIQTAGAVRDALVSALNTNVQVPLLWVIVVATYFPLASLPLSARLLEMQWPVELKALLLQQISEPAEELQLRASIPRLTTIDDEVSMRVQDQYEESPYPRWVKVTRMGKEKNLVEYLSQRFPLVTKAPYDKVHCSDILIAGCGTGQHSIGVAQRFQEARILAVDLSMSSLCYAKRKTQEHGLTSIEYAHADLLRLGSLGRSFDAIESVGVLHHLADPWSGWQILLSLLRPGGFMKLGFYSELGRRHVVKVQRFIADQAYGATAADIRRCRQRLFDMDDGERFATTLKAEDFFSLSTCRDLLFHVQEHRMALNQIDRFIGGNNLKFLGFEISPNVLDVYRKRFPRDPSTVNLIQWEIFEHENPDTFAGMYQFWVQKLS